MRLLDILKEVIDEEIRKKEKLNKRGMFKSVYDFESKPGYVLKTWNDGTPLVKKEYEVFEKHPDLFANIIKVNWDRKWIAQEKLDSDRAYKELSDLSDDLDMTAFDLSGHLESVVSEPDTLYNDYNLLSTVNPSNIPVYKKWVDFYKKIDKIDIGGYKDLNPGNFGYDKAGNLKLLDI